MNKLKEKEYQILQIISESKVPVGSGAISRKMKVFDREISEATTGRHLRDLDHQGLTEKKGFMGRILTPAGEGALREHDNQKELQENTDLFMRLTRAGAKKELLQILVARRAIEKETCRLAAENATDEDIRLLSDIVNLHLEHATGGMSGAVEDNQFHKTIARISGNQLLEAALDLIRQNGQLCPVLEYIRERVGSAIVADHQKILEAIEQRDPLKAEQTMTVHIENVMADVNKYWDIVNRSN